MFVTNTSKVKINYVGTYVSQNFNVIPQTEYTQIKLNADTCKDFSKKAKAEFMKVNKCEIADNEITEESPIGKAIMGKRVGEIGIMILPITQGGEHGILIESILN